MYIFFNSATIANFTRKNSTAMQITFVRSKGIKECTESLHCLPLVYSAAAPPKSTSQGWQGH